MIDLVEAGFTKKSYGASGALKIYLDPIFYPDFSNCDFIFIEIQGSRVPFFIVGRANENRILRLEDVNSPEQAGKLTNKKIFLERKNLSDSNIHKEITDENLLIGYTLIDNTSGIRVGEIIEIRKFPQQLMLFVNNQNEEWMIPLASEWIINIDPDKKKILMNLPEGIY